MDASLFFAAAVLAGFVLIALVVYSYVRPQPEHRPSVTALLGLLGFALVASPNWTSISIKSEGLELSLLREMQARQLEVLTELQGRSGELPAAAPSAGAAGPRTTPRSAAPERGAPAGRDASQRESGAGERSEARAPDASDGAGEQILEAFDRGELDLRALSTAELLALNARLNELAKAERR